MRIHPLFEAWLDDDSGDLHGKTWLEWKRAGRPVVEDEKDVKIEELRHKIRSLKSRMNYWKSLGARLEKAEKELFTLKKKGPTPAG